MMDVMKSASQLFSVKVVKAVISFIGLAWFAQNLGPKLMGTYFIFEALLGLLSLLFDFGMRGAVEKRLSEDSSSPQILGTALFLEIIFNIIGIICIILLADIINSYMGMELSYLLAIAIVFRNFSTFITRVLHGELRVGETAYLRLFRWIIWSSFGWLLVVEGFGVRSLIISLIAGDLVVLFAGFKLKKTRVGRPDTKIVPSLINYSKNIMLSSVGQYLINWSDILILSILLSNYHVGIYETAWRVAAVATMWAHSLATSSFPQISDWDSKGKIDRIDDIVRKNILLVVIITIPAFFGALLLSKDILKILFGNEFGAGSGVLVVLMAGKIFHSVYIIIRRVLQAIDRPHLVVRAMVFTNLINILLNISLVWLIGLPGAAIATTTAVLANTYLTFRYTRSCLSMSIPTMGIGWSLLSSIIMVITVKGFMHFVKVDGLLSLLIVVFSGGLFYFSILMMSNQIRTSVSSVYN